MFKTLKGKLSFAMYLSIKPYCSFRNVYVYINRVYKLHHLHSKLQKLGLLKKLKSLSIKYSFTQKLKNIEVFDKVRTKNRNSYKFITTSYRKVGKCIKILLELVNKRKIIRHYIIKKQ